MAATPASSSARPCLYAVLGVARGVSVADVGCAYRNRVKEWQLEGDSSTTAESRARFLLMKEACEVLSDVSRRALYDRGVYPVPSDFQLSNYLFPSVNSLLAEMERLRNRVSKFNERMKKDRNLTMDQMLVMLQDVNKPEDPPQAAPPKRRGRPPKNNNDGPSRPAAPGGAGVPKKKPAAAPKPRGKKGAGTLASGPHGAKRAPPPGFDGPCACVMKSLRIRASNC